MKNATLPRSSFKAPKNASQAVKQRWYLCIDLKSFYASVECVERGLDPMKTDLVVADPERTRGTICLAVSPSLKEKGVKNRCRLFEIPEKLLKDTIVAPPRMQKYIDYAARIYGVYLKYISKEDIYVYSVDEAFLDVTDYLKLYRRTPREMAEFLMREVLRRVGVRATAGVGTNLYLAKVALDITAKHASDFIGELTEESYRATLWDHKPLTDFWRIGPGISRNLERHGIHTMGELARADEDTLYGIFGKNAELLIDHAWGREPVTIFDIKNAHAKERSYSMGQVLPRNYDFDKTLLAVREMARDLCLRLTREEKVMRSMTLTLGYSYKADEGGQSRVSGSAGADGVDGANAGMEGSFARSVKGLPHGTVRFTQPTNSISVVAEKVTELYRQIADPSGQYRRIYLNCNHVTETAEPAQRSLFATDGAQEKDDRQVQEAMLDIQKRYGKTAIMRGEDLESGSTYRWRSGLIGGHKSGTEGGDVAKKGGKDAG